METNPAAPASPAPAPATGPPAANPAPPPAPGSSLRLVILLGVLVLVVGTFAYDQFVIKPDCDKAFAKIQKLVDDRNKQGVKVGSLVTSKDIQKELGRVPTWTKDDPKRGYTIEHYCWWGKTPLMTRRRHFIAIVYVGAEPRHFSSHYQEEPPPEALPIEPKPPEDDGTTFPHPETTPGDIGKAKQADDKGESTEKPAEPAAKTEGKADEAKSPEAKSEEKAKDKS